MDCASVKKSIYSKPNNNKEKTNKQKDKKIGK